MLKKFLSSIVGLLGLKKDSEYVKNHNIDANVSSSMYNTSLMIVIEIWMIIRYTKRYVLDAEIPADFPTWLKYTRSFWGLLFAAIIVLIYDVMYKKGKIKSRTLGNVVMILFAGYCLIFGMYVSHHDFAAGKMITCFFVMALYAACLLIWKPYVSIIFLTVLFFGYSYYLDNYTFDKEGVQVIMLSGDRVNYYTLLITLIMIAISIYHQRVNEAVKSEELERIAVEDDLTGVPNMYYFGTQCKKMMGDAAVKPSDKLYLFMNIENFKTYNDQLGYEKGNEFLKNIANRFKEVFKDGIFARQSDDHFVALVNKAKKDEYINKAVNVLAEEHPEVYMSLKVGGYSPINREETQEICCDRARYACGLIKNKYGEVYREYDKKMDESFHLRQYIVNHIDQAVEKGYIKVYYQPVVWSKNGKLCSCEALARWDDPVYGFLSPGKFISVLEECRLIHKLDKCIYEQVCKDMHASIKEGRKVIPVSMNFSRLDFELMDVVQVMTSLVEKYEIPKENIHIEVTESALGENQASLKAALNRLRELGFALWLDDFGSGYSSLNVLKDYKFDVLKVDMVFLSNLQENESAQKILACIIDMADRLGMQTLTEGVESSQAAEYLNKIGCGRLQGYLYGKPMPYEELIEKIRAGELEITDEKIC